MPRAFCPACLTRSRVEARQCGRQVICPACQAKFAVPLLPPLKPDPVKAGITLLAILAVFLVVAIKLWKPSLEPQSVRRAAPTGLAVMVRQ